jgi:hypothetical protein
MVSDLMEYRTTADTKNLVQALISTPYLGGKMEFTTSIYLACVKMLDLLTNGLNVPEANVSSGAFPRS